MIDLGGRVALVTGSVGGGIGRSTALALARHGADIVLNYGTAHRGGEAVRRAEQVAAVITGVGRKVLVAEADTSDPEQVEQMFFLAQSEFRGVDILVNNAGGTWNDLDFVDADPPRWQRTLAAEVEGPAFAMRLALPHMRQQRWGRIINIAIDLTVLNLLLTSAYSHVLDKYPYPFAVGKVARQTLTELVAYSELKHGITVNSVQPGIIEEMSFEEAVALNADPQHGSRVYAAPTDVANAIVFLCSEEARFLTNSVLRVPGNLYSRLPP